MSYNPSLASRLRERLHHLPNIEEKEMMGGLVFMLNDKMCVGIIKDELMCRIDPERHEMGLKIGTRIEQIKTDLFNCIYKNIPTLSFLIDNSYDKENHCFNRLLFHCSPPCGGWADSEILFNRY